MTCPTKRKGSENWHFRRRIPAEIRSILAKLPKSQRPKNWYATEIAISLGTADRAAAKAKFPEIADEVEKTMARLRAGPVPLTPKQINALSGELYGALAEGLEENPVLTAEQWLKVATKNEEARQGRFGIAPLQIHRTAEERRRASMEARFGKVTDTFLRQRGLHIDADSRWRLLECASIELSAAAKKLARNANNHYEADTYKAKFTKFVPARKDAEGSRTSLTALLNAWHSAALLRMTKRDADRMKSRMEKFIAFLGHDSIERTTTDDVIRWAEHRRRTASFATVNNSDLASIKNVFGWAAKKPRAWIEKNPAAGVKAEGKKKARVREPFFDQREISAILSAALAVTKSKRGAPKTDAAKRWVPWLCAYSGARVTEMIQLRKQDVRKEREGWIIRLTPEAGNIKNDEFRDVPVHSHLVELGFIDFVNGSAEGPLFCNVGKDGTTAGPAMGVYQRIRQLVRGVVKAKTIQPNHAWRYTFKTIGVDAELPKLVIDAICGHAPKTKGDEYARITMKARAATMNKFPRYTLQAEAD
ncbi:DUF6538 domain-containing protein [Tardiphaga sp. 619_E2_N8_5]